MNRYGKHSGGGPSKATPSTLCQKCLKRDIYECKAVAQDRPYVPRPSRTQQLLNPKLLPKLTSDVPQDLLRKKGVADEQLARIEQERGRKRDRSEGANESGRNQNRSLSASSNSSASVATISTNASQPAKRDREAEKHSDLQFSPSKAHMGTSEKKRRRSLSSNGSFVSDLDTSHGRVDVESSRSIRRRIGEHSPLTRGRRRSRSGSRTRHASSSSSSRSSRQTRHKRNSEWVPRSEMETTTGTYRTGPEGRSTRKDKPDPERMRQSFRGGNGSLNWKPSQKRNEQQKVDESLRGAVNSASARRPQDRSLSNDGLRPQHYSDLDERHGTSVNFNERSDGRPLRASLRERSLSPFSKRLALTQAMNAGR